MLFRLQLYFITVFLWCFSAKSQQVAQLSQWTQVPMLLNPAMSVAQKDIRLDAGFRKQWAGLQGSPQTQILAVNLPIVHWNTGIGAIVGYETIGAETNLSLAIASGYQWKKKRYTLAVGIAAGMTQKGINGAALITPEGDYQNNINHEDALLPVKNVVSWRPDATFGIYFENKSWNIGCSFQQLLPFDYQFSDIGSSLYVAKSNVQLYIMRKIALTRQWSLLPWVIAKSDGIQHQAEVALNIKYEERFRIGAAYRGLNNADAAIASASVQLNSIWTLGYAFEMPLSAIQQASSASHELFISYRFKGLLPDGDYKKRYNTRFL
ncbi:MAG: PorP/SprF family type IX secretion system membrane protein [Sphingobacteriales bacterium]|nr:PorP/SprF family type IX secretion system membrane protein [Sphingobacteriales bacterium]